MRVALLVNPKSGSAPQPDELEPALHEAGAKEVRSFALDEASQIPGWKPDRVAVAGGDGSLGCAFETALAAGVPLAVIASGTANDFAAAHDLPTERGPAVALAGNPHAHWQAVWGGTAAGRPFVNVASVGLAVDAAEFAEELKQRAGPAAYALGAARAGMRAHPVHVTVRLDGEEIFDGRVWQLLVGATGRFGGGSGLGEADARRGHLTVAIVPAGTRLTLPLRAVGLRRRAIERQSGVIWGRTEQLQVEASAGGRAITWNLDGELWRPPSGVVELAAIGPVELIGGGKS